MKKNVMMTDLAEDLTDAPVKRRLPYWNHELQRLHSPILRYGFSVVSVAVALGLAFALQYYQFHDVELPGFTVAIAFTTWYAGIGPCVLAVILSSACFDFFFTEPIYSFDISGDELAYYFIFVVWAAIVASFSAVRLPDRGQPSSSPRQAADRGGTTQAPRGGNSQTQSGTRQTGGGTRDDQQGIGIFHLFRLPRPAGATSPHGRILGAAAKTGIVFARREESAIHTNDSRSQQKKWAT